jgi:carboxypeptidase Taq
VLKPNRAYGGEGVAIGALCSEAEWDRLLDDAVRKAADPNSSWVLQSATRLPIVEFPVAGNDGRVYGEPFYAVMGFAPTDNGLGILCRVSQKQVVNVAQHGGLAAVLIANPPKDLRIPQRSLKRKGDASTALRLQIAELHHLDQTIALLEWDEETYLPPAGLAQRGEQTAALESLRHGILVSDHFADLIEEAAAETDGDIDLERELFLVRRERHRALAFPESLVRKFANARARTLGAWEEARDKNDFAPFAGAFGELLHIVRDRAQCQSTDAERYDCLLDEYEPGMTRARLEPLFAEIRQRLIPLVQQASKRSERWNSPLEGRRFAEQQQWELSRRMLAAIGFDFERGRLDPTTHPFTMLVGHDDVRVTSRANESDIMTNLLATMHEGGHGLYDQGLAPGDRNRFLGDGPSMGMHEAQARLWENHVGRNLAFSQFLFPQLRELFGVMLDGVSAESFWRALNRVRPSANRIGADEMSYHLHIILRTELEAALVSDQLSVADLPQAWNDRSQALLGIRPSSPREGVLQDVHWAVGMFGYFPTYTIGSLYAAQLVETYARQHKFDDEIRTGEFGKLREWLRTKVYEFGNRHSAEEIVTRATGKGLDTAAFFRHVESPERAWNQARQ